MCAAYANSAYTRVDDNARIAIVRRRSIGLRQRWRAHFGPCRKNRRVTVPLQLLRMQMSTPSSSSSLRTQPAPIIRHADRPNLTAARFSPVINRSASARSSDHRVKREYLLAFPFSYPDDRWSRSNATRASIIGHRLVRKDIVFIN